MAGAYAISAPARGENEDRPLWEVGIAAIGGEFPDYPGSSQSHFHALPLPYVIYRGEYFQLSPTTARGIIVNAPAVSLDVSASGAFRSSHNNQARAGMPGLDYTGQIGPRLNILLAHDAMYAKVDLELPVRAVFSTNLKTVDYRGVLMAPELAYTHGNFMNSGGRFKMGVGPEFATARLMQYFYTVEPQFVTSTRPQFNATGGYLGARFEVSYRRSLNDRMTILALLAPELYSGATNARSPLFKKQFGVSAALGVTFSFYGSTARATGETDADADPDSSPRPRTAELRSDSPPPVPVPTSAFTGRAVHAERATPANPEPISSPQPLIAAVRSDDLPPASVQATDPQAAAAPADDLPPVANGAADVWTAAQRDDDPPAVPPPAQQSEFHRERDLSGWTDRLFANLESDPQQQNFVMISGASGDPRARANEVCARVGLMASLVKAERRSGANPDEDKIAWHFACRY
jgi:MipA family protein